MSYLGTTGYDDDYINCVYATHALIGSVRWYLSVLVYMYILLSVKSEASTNEQT
jgi:hypothetical protein